MIINQSQINEQDLEQIFSGKRRRKRSLPMTVIKFSLLAILFFVLAFVGINYQAILHQVNFWYQKDYKASDKSDNKSSITTSQNNQNSQSVALPQFAENHILISKIDVNAPVSWNVPNNEASVGKNLENGAIHLSGTALPGTIGNVFVTAHSSNYAWAPGNYKSLFSLLNKLVVGDEIYLKRESKTYAYKVYKIKITNPDDLSVLNQGNNSILTLMTCAPVGTSLNRLIVLSKQTYPDPISNVPAGVENTNSSLPNIR